MAGAGGTEKLKDCLIGLDCKVPFEKWIAARPKDTLTWKVRELRAAFFQYSCVFLTRE